MLSPWCAYLLLLQTDDIPTIILTFILVFLLKVLSIFNLQLLHKYISFNQTNEHISHHAFVQVVVAWYATFHKRNPGLLERKAQTLSLERVAVNACYMLAHLAHKHVVMVPGDPSRMFNVDELCFPGNNILKRVIVAKRQKRVNQKRSKHKRASNSVCMLQCQGEFSHAAHTFLLRNV